MAQTPLAASLPSQAELGTQGGQEPELGSPDVQGGGENEGGWGAGAASRMCNSRRQQELRRLWVIWGIFGKCERDVSLSERKASGGGCRQGSPGGPAEKARAGSRNGRHSY